MKHNLELFGVLIKGDQFLFFYIVVIWIYVKRTMSLKRDVPFILASNRGRRSGDHKDP